MVILGIVLARAGSKGLPDKCVRPLLGRALIEHTFEHALGSRRLTALLLTTDSGPAKELARSHGIEIVDRPAELASDTASVDAAARHAVETWEQRHRQSVDAVVLLYGNIPVRAVEPGNSIIDRCVDHLIATGATSVRTVAPIGRHHPDWLHRLQGDRMTQYRANSIYRRQDLEPLHYHDGAVAAVTRAALFGALPEDHQSFLGADRRAIIQRPEDAVDVDDATDLLMAEAVLRSRLPASGGAIRIGPHAVATTGRVYVIAEGGVNHDGSLDKALRLIDAAAEAGADAVKFQIFRADELASAAAPLAEYQRGGVQTSQRDMLRRLEFDDAAWKRLRDHCQARGIEFLATPFSVADIDRLMELDAPAIKVASTDLDNVPLLRRAAQTGLPLILSTGASTQCEIGQAVRWMRRCGSGERLVLLHCVSRYPTPVPDANLGTIAALHQTFALPVGYSDHTTSTQTGAWAVAAGACVLEKHFTLDRAAAGPDHAMSLDPTQLRSYVEQARAAQGALGNCQIGMTPAEEEVRRIARKSVVAAMDLRAGTRITLDMLALKRPAGGISPAQMDELAGRVLRTDVAADQVLHWDAVAPQAAGPAGV